MYVCIYIYIYIYIYATDIEQSLFINIANYIINTGCLKIDATHKVG